MSKRSSGRRTAKARPKRSATAPTPEPAPPPPSEDQSTPVIGKRGFFFASAAALLSGGCLMVMEIVASRVLAPAFGNTIFVWTSVIGLIMAALSAGYWLGGALADRRPRLATLCWSLLLAGVGVGLVPLLAGVVVSSVGARFGGMTGPLVTSALLFVAPGVLIGSVSPIAVKLVALGGAEVGHASGRISALGALGSIVGTLLAGFVFIPMAGNTAILVGIALTLAILGAVGFALDRSPPARPAAMVGLTLVLSATAAAGEARTPDDVLMDQQTFYHRVRVHDQQWRGRPARILSLDTTNEGAMFLDGPGLPFEYTRYIDVADLFLTAPRSAAFVGGGSFAMPKRFLRRHEGASAVALELDPLVVEAGQRFFELDQVDNLETRTGDARQNLARSEERFDLIFGDAYNGVRSVPAHLATVEYYRLVHAHLRAGGIYMSNIISAVTGPRAGFFRSTVRTLREVFPEVYAFALGGGRGRSQNIILVCPVMPYGLSPAEIRRGRRSPGLNELTRSIIDLEEIERLSRPFDEAPLLTDDHSPVETLVAE